MTKRAGGRKTRPARREASAPYEKIAISLPSRAAEHVRRAVRNGEAKSVSAYITDAIEEKAKTESLAEMLDKMLEESGGPMTTAEARWADRKLGVTRGAVKKRKPK
jgi:Arc/MetJ-type ribon-helix-helix transcriptional regulator